MRTFLTRGLISACVFASLSACELDIFNQDPMEGVALLSEVELDENIATVSLAETAGASISSLFAGLVTSLGDGRAPDTELQEAALTTIDNSNSSSFFNLFSRPNTPPATPENLTHISFGELRRNCAISRADMGTKITSDAGFSIYDTAPNTATARSHFITGFDDNCPREFIGALVLLGDVGTHEIVRYANTNVDLAYSVTDDAYEAIKSGYCRAGFGEPCGRRLESLGRKATFVTVYERFGDSPEWAEFLLFDGAVAATDIESP